MQQRNIGNTPLVLLENILDQDTNNCKICAKLESYNYTGSIKVRVAYEMLNDALMKKQIKPGATIIEPTSGNTGIALAALCKELGYRCIIVMPDNMSIERQQLISSYGAKLVLTPASLGMTGSINKAEELNREIEGSFIPAQFDNIANVNAHYKTTGPEIYRQTNNKIDVFISAVGTGGTITGIGKFLKEQNNSIKIVAVEPETSAVISGKPAGQHAIQGIGAGFIPKILDVSLLDEVVTVTDEEAFHYCKLINKEENISAGISSGSALCAAIKIAKKSKKPLNIVTVFPDDATKYRSVLEV